MRKRNSRADWFEPKEKCSLSVAHRVLRARARNRKLPKGKAVNPDFEFTFLTAVGITLFAIAAEIVMAAVWISPTPDQQSAFEAVSFAWKAGVGAIFGRLSGRIT